MKKSKKNKVNYNFPKETCELIAERDGNECLFCKLGYHMDKCRSEMLLGIPDIHANTIFKALSLYVYGIYMYFFIYPTPFTKITATS